MKTLETPLKNTRQFLHNRGIKKIFGIPKNGLIVAFLLKDFEVVFDPEEADAIVDDIIDSGKTFEKYSGIKVALFGKKYSPKIDFIAEIKEGWIDIPWEKEEKTGEEGILRIIEQIGENPNREGLLDTPKRFVKAIKQVTEGYSRSFEKECTAFDSEGFDEIILLKDVPFSSTCEHHLFPFFGKVHIGYIPNKKIAGISKLARIVDIFSQRLQNQERIGMQIADQFEKSLFPLAFGIVIEGEHQCMACRGVRKNAKMITSVMRGIFKENAMARAEFFSLIK